MLTFICLQQAHCRHPLQLNTLPTPHRHPATQLSPCEHFQPTKSQNTLRCSFFLQIKSGMSRFSGRNSRPDGTVKVKPAPQCWERCHAHGILPNKRCSQPKQNIPILLKIIDSTSYIFYAEYIELFYLPTLMHNFLYSLTIYMLHYYPRHVSSIKR